MTAAVLSKHQIGRAIGTAAAALSTLMAGLLVVWLFDEPSEQSLVWLFVGPIGLVIAVIGVWAWWQGRWALAAVGMWVAAAADIAWYSAVLLPVTLALIATILAFKKRGTLA
ncbi:MAG: hypothetical protein WDA27_15265 [Actinomycetota bacterium]